MCASPTPNQPRRGDGASLSDRPAIRYIGDRRLSQLGLKPIFGMQKNPLPWMDQMLGGAEHTNFFENRATEYSKASTQGSWEDAFEDGVFKAA